MTDHPLMLFAKSDLKRNDFRVLWMLMAQLDLENWIVINQAEIAGKLGMHRQNVNRSIKRLIDMEALLEGPHIGMSRSYRFNPEFGSDRAT